MARGLERLDESEAHLHWVRAEQALDPTLTAAYAGLMTDEERARHDRYYFEKNRAEFLLTRALVRTTLSRYADVDPRAWRFRANAYGCPSIDSPSEHAWLRFNLTNTTGLVALIVARDRDVGVDVEDTTRRGETVAIADRFFSEAEVAELHTVPADRQRARFFDYWTLKEAYIKARGMGLAIPLGHFSFAIPASGPISIAFDPRLEDDPASWQFAQFRPTEHHLVSAAVRKGAAAPLAIRVTNTVPKP